MPNQRTELDGFRPRTEDEKEVFHETSSVIRRRLESRRSGGSVWQFEARLGCALHTFSLHGAPVGHTIWLVRSTGRTQEYLTTARVARILGISKRTLHNWIKAGKVTGPEVNPGNGYLQWTMSDVETVRTVLMEEPSDSTGNR